MSSHEPAASRRRGDPMKDKRMAYAMKDFIDCAPERFGIDSFIAREMVNRCVRAENRITDFFLRNNLPFHEIKVVQMPSGEMYPQWKGAIALLQPSDTVELL
jgi:hypothetical protein